MDTWSDSGNDNDEENNHLKKIGEDIVNIAIQKKTVVKRNLIQLIETILASYELQEKYSTKLTPFCMITINDLIKKKPEYFRMVESTLVRNIHNNKIKSEDIPYIISIISQLYNLLLAQYNDSKNRDSIIDTCSNSLKFIFSVSLRENLIKIDSETDIILLLLCFDNIIDSCMKLLKPFKYNEFIREEKKQLELVVPTPIMNKQAEKKACC
jgi:hypothetical protein